MINLDENQSISAHLVSVFINRNTTVYFYFSGTEYISQEVLNKIKDKFIVAYNIFRIHSNDSIMCEFYCIGFIKSMIAIKNILDYTY